MNLNSLIVTPKQMKKLENASHIAGVSLSCLMDNAGFELANFIMHKTDNVKSKICFLCGKGNNGGDGFVSANILAQKGYSVCVMLLCDSPCTELSISAYKSIKNVEIITDNFIEHLASDFDVLVDCVYGTGFRGTLSNKIASVFDVCNKISAMKIACDIPSGVCAFNGVADKSTIMCDYTVTFGALKCGMAIQPATQYCGEITICDIKIPKKTYQDFKFNCNIIDESFIKDTIKKRNPLSHKGDFGKLLNISGCKNYVGAATLSTLSALRSGVGICTLASTEYVSSIVATNAFETTFMPLSSNLNGMISKNNAEIIIEKCKNSSAVLFGCGCGQSEDITYLAKQIIKNTKCPLIIDADGINAIQNSIDILKDTEASIIITPHPGELSRLCGVSISEVVSRRIELAIEFACNYNVIVVAKGSDTIIATPQGDLYISKTGNSGLSRGGSGDVLAGIIASFSAQGISCVNSACAGTFLHGYTADIVAQKKSMQGMLPTDIIDELPFVFKAFER